MLEILASGATEATEKTYQIIYGLQDWNPEDLERLIVRFLLNFGLAFIILRGIYYRASKRKDYLFSFLLTNAIVFFIVYTLKSLDIKAGIGLGLFAIFGILRFRTATMPVKEMTYLFIVVGVAVVNGMSGKKFSWPELFFVNGSLMAIIFLVEQLLLANKETRKVITYEKIKNIKAQNHEALKADLEERTGIKIDRFEIGKINFLNDTAQITIFFDGSTQPAAYSNETPNID